MLEMIPALEKIVYRQEAEEIYRKLTRSGHSLLSTCILMETKWESHLMDGLDQASSPIHFLFLNRFLQLSRWLDCCVLLLCLPLLHPSFIKSIENDYSKWPFSLWKRRRKGRGRIGNIRATHIPLKGLFVLIWILMNLNTYELFFKLAPIKWWLKRYM